MLGPVKALKETEGHFNIMTGTKIHKFCLENIPKNDELCKKEVDEWVKLINDAIKNKKIHEINI